MPRAGTPGDLHIARPGGEQWQRGHGRGLRHWQLRDSTFIRSSTPYATARAIQMGQPPPDPFGLGTTFSTGFTPGDRMDVSKVPVGALVLIGLGAIFLLHTLDIWDFSAHRVWPLLLIGIGGFLLLRRLGLIGEVPPGFDRARSCRRGLMGPVILLTLGRSVSARQHGRQSGSAVLCPCC